MVLIHKLVLGLLLGVDVREAHIVDSKLKMLTVLHDGHGESHHVELVGECSFKLLFVGDEHAISEHSPLARQLGRENFDCRHLTIKL